MPSWPKAAASRARAPIASHQPRGRMRSTASNPWTAWPRSSASAPCASIPTSSLAQARQQHAARKGAGRAEQPLCRTGAAVLGRNGEPLAILPDGVMQRMRVGAANGLGVKYLARENAKSVGILGSGWQAGAQLMAACAVRDIETIRCFSPNPAKPRSLRRRDERDARRRGRTGRPPEEAIKGADIVMCATNSIDHIFFERWIEPGMHLSAIKRPEIEAKAIKRADRVVDPYGTSQARSMSPPRAW